MRIKLYLVQGVSKSATSHVSQIRLKAKKLLFFVRGTPALSIAVHSLLNFVAKIEFEKKKSNDFKQ